MFNNEAVPQAQLWPPTEGKQEFSQHTHTVENVWTSILNRYKYHSEKVNSEFSDNPLGKQFLVPYPSWVRPIGLNQKFWIENSISHNFCFDGFVVANTYLEIEPSKSFSETFPVIYAHAIERVSVGCWSLEAGFVVVPVRVFVLLRNGGGRVWVGGGHTHTLFLAGKQEFNPIKKHDKNVLNS